MAAQLPHELGRFLTEPLISERFDLDEFFRRVAQREDVDLPKAIFHARAVLSVLEEAITPGWLNKVLDQLPPDYDQFFEAAGSGPIP